MQASVLYPSGNILGESPLWHHGRQSFFWVDIDGFCFQELQWNSRKLNQWKLDYRVSLLVETENDNILLLALQGGIALFDLRTRELAWLAGLEKEISNNRTNDGACDALGRLWIGTMDRQCVPGKGALYLMNEDLELQKKINGTAVSNGIVWSPDGTIMYYIDSPTQKVDAYTYDLATGGIQFSRTAVTLDKTEGSPDGMCIDEEGMLWIAQWGSSSLCRWNPLTGKLLEKIELPVPQVSACCFGGPDMDQLLITTAKENMSEKDLKKYPLSGHVFIAAVNAKGIPRNRFKSDQTS